MNSGSSVVASRAADTSLPWLADYFELTKPRIGMMVLITVAVSGFLATWGQPDSNVLILALIGTGCVAGSASVWNHWWEQQTDARMQRTKDRCLPAGRLPSRDAAIFGAALLAAGVTLLTWGTTVVAAAIACATWCIYVMIYTPLKRRTVWNTFVGAIPGAMPVLIGWTAMGESLDVLALIVFGTVFFWQFPHFMAIAWRYRHDYARAEMQMSTVVDPTGHRAGRLAIVGASALLILSLIPVWLTPASILMAVVVLILSIWFLTMAIGFGRDPNDHTARRLLRGSLWYLPAVMISYCLIPWLT